MFFFPPKNGFLVFRRSKGQQSADRLFQMWQPLASFQQMRGGGLRLELNTNDFYLALVSLGRILLASQCQGTHLIRFFQARFSPRGGRGTEQEKVKNKFAIQWNGGVFDID